MLTRVLLVCYEFLPSLRNIAWRKPGRSIPLGTLSRSVPWERGRVDVDLHSGSVLGVLGVSIHKTVWRRFLWILPVLPLSVGSFKYSFSTLFVLFWYPTRMDPTASKPFPRVHSQSCLLTK